MKSDLDRLMKERDLTALTVLIGEVYSPALDYLTGKLAMTNGLAIKVRGGDPVLIANPMETEEAAANDHTVINRNDLGYEEVNQKNGGDYEQSMAVVWGRALQRLNTPPGRVGVYGLVDASESLAMVSAAAKLWPNYQFVGESGVPIFEAAGATKDVDELARIQSVAQRTNEVLRAIWDFISSHQLQDGTVVNGDGTPLTIGDVKRFVAKALMERDLEENGMIFAQGRDGGFPHSRGQHDQPLKAGQAIVFDLFPHERGGGYFHDVTRTWCIDHAPENVRQAYETVREAYDVAIEAYALNKPTYLMQEAVQDFLEARGHLTSRSDPETTVGYMHGLGHGIGLNIHEAPSIKHFSKEPRFEVGQVITIEPGLYYPDEGFGVRYENALYIAEDGSLVTLTDFPDDLVLPLTGGDSA